MAKVGSSWTSFRFPIPPTPNALFVPDRRRRLSSCKRRASRCHTWIAVIQRWRIAETRWFAGAVPEIDAALSRRRAESAGIGERTIARSSVPTTSGSPAAGHQRTPLPRVSCRPREPPLAGPRRNPERTSLSNAEQSASSGGAGGGATTYLQGTLELIAAFEEFYVRNYGAPDALGSGAVWLIGPTDDRCLRLGSSQW